MLNAKGVEYTSGKDNMSDNIDKKEVDKKKGMASTPSHGLPPKDFSRTVSSSSQATLTPG
jgi:hypothetical protein